MNLVDECADARVLILGMIRDGPSTLAFLRRRMPGKRIGLADATPLERLEPATRDAIQRDKNVRLFLGDGYLDSIAEHNVIFRSAGISPFLIPELAAARAQGKLISSNTQLFFDFCSGPIIGVTGTKGKSTSTTLIHHVLRTAGLDVQLTGTARIPPLPTLENVNSQTSVVIELSCHQLTDLGRSPHIAVLQNIVPEHLDFYPSFDEYVRAKAAITRYQSPSDLLLYNVSYPIPRSIASDTAARTVPFGVSGEAAPGCFLDDGWICVHTERGAERIMCVGDIPLRGSVNVQNVMPAVLVGRAYGIPPDTIARAIKAFRSLERRLEFVGEVSGVKFFDDSLATVPEATIAAMDAFPEAGLVLLVGGRDGQQHYGDLARAILSRNTKGVMLFPPSGARLWTEILTHCGNCGRLPAHVRTDRMSDAVSAAFELAAPGDVVVLSPAAGCGDGFANYREKSEQFTTQVRQLGRRIATPASSRRTMTPR